MKKILTIALSSVLLLSTLPYAEVVETTPINFTMESAIDALLKDNMDLKLSILGIDAAKVAQEESKRAGDRIRDIRETGGYSSYYSELFGSAAGQYMLRGVPEKAADLELMVAEKTLAMTQSQLKIALKQSFYGLLSAQESLAIKEQSAARLKELYDISTQKYALGLISKNALSTAKVEYENGLSAIETAKRDFAYSKMQFNQIMNRPLDAAFTLQGVIAYTPIIESALSEKIAFALENRMDVVAASQAKEIAEVTYAVDQSYYASNTFLYKKSYINVEKARFQYQQSLVKAEMAVRKSFNDLKAAEQAYLDLQKSVALAKDGYAIAKTMYSVGMNTQTDVNAALIQYNTLENNLNSALLGLKLAEMSFEASYSIGLGQ